MIFQDPSQSPKGIISKNVIESNSENFNEKFEWSLPQFGIARLKLKKNLDKLTFTVNSRANCLKMHMVVASSGFEYKPSISESSDGESYVFFSFLIGFKTNDFGETLAINNFKKTGDLTSQYKNLYYFEFDPYLYVFCPFWKKDSDGTNMEITLEYEEYSEIHSEDEDIQKDPEEMMDVYKSQFDSIIKNGLLYFSKSFSHYMKFTSYKKESIDEKTLLEVSQYFF